MAWATQTLLDYPRVIEPAASVLEMRVDKGDGARLAHLVRLDPVLVNEAVVSVPNSAVHMFGEDSDIAKCVYIMAYGADGLLVAIFTRDRTGWEVFADFAGDITGTRPALPSLRMVFNDQRSRDLFLYYLQQVGDGEIVNPSLAAALDNLAEDIRIIDVVPMSA